ncbi:MAG TPA: outer membrane beta-barrel protein [Clostridia bacterium]|nr:outer membrane beta-barrel protein [Clostridia bacterium]
MRRLLLCVLLAFVSMSALAQESYVGRYNAFTGFSYLSTPKMNLFQRGFNGEAGINVNRWLALGADFSMFKGHSSLTPEELTDAHQANLAPLLPLLPPGTKLSVPYDAETYTFSAGPQVNIRKLNAVTFFVRPAFGILYEKVTGKPDNPLATTVVTGLVGPSKAKSDTVLFYGFGGGMDLNVSKHVALRFAADFVHTNLFEGMLREGRNSVRFSTGPTFRFGKNVGGKSVH